jgi:hypothetical protein
VTVLVIGEDDDPSINSGVVRQVAAADDVEWTRSSVTRDYPIDEPTGAIAVAANRGSSKVLLHLR